MPIDIQSFEAAPEARLRTDQGDRSPADVFYSYLAAHPDRAFTLRELRQTLDLPRGCIGVTAVGLEDEGLVRHRGDYWAVGDPPTVTPNIAGGTDTASQRRLTGSEGERATENVSITPQHR